MNQRKKPFLALLGLALIFAACKDDFEPGPRASDLFHVKNGDYLIPVLVRGNTASGKIILFIQGGPGSNTLDFAEIDYPNWKNTLEKEYAVAYYDQRGTGNSQGTFTLGADIYETYTDDLHKVAMFLQKAYGADVVMLGHSFGGRLMYEYMIRFGESGVPVKYISANGIATTDSDADTLRWKFRREFLYNTANLEISRGRNVDAWNEVLDWLEETPVIAKVEGDNPWALMDQWNGYVEKLVYEYYPERALKTRDYLQVLFSSPYNPLPAFLSGKDREDLERMFAAADDLGYENGVQLAARLPQIDFQSVLLLTGRYDDVCTPEELTYIFDQVTSPNREIQVIDYAGHEIFTHQPEEFFNTIKTFIEE